MPSDSHGDCDATTPRAHRLSAPVQSVSRRRMVQASAAGLLSGPGALRSAMASESASGSTPKSVIFVWLTGGLSHQDTFDMKPLAPADVRGEFDPVDTQTPGIQVCEHLPGLARLSNRWSVLRSLSTESNGHGPACHMLLTGRVDLPPGFSAQGPTPNDWPSMGAMITSALRGDGSLPPAAILPQPSINEANKTRPGQFAGRLGSKHEAWHIDIAANCPLGNGACPNCFRFDEDTFEHAADSVFNTPDLKLPSGGLPRLRERLGLLGGVEQQRPGLGSSNAAAQLSRSRQQALNLLTDPRTSSAFDVEHADPRTVARYGKNKFGLSLLMARKLVESGVRYVQVNLGKNSSWDTHRRNFINLRRNLLPYLDQSMSALISDLDESGMLDDTLVIMTGEFGRTPKINKDSGRDHWGPLNSALFAGGGTQPGRVVGASDNIAAYPIDDLQRPENLAATVYSTLGIPRDSEWIDVDGRPYQVYRGNPILGLY